MTFILALPRLEGTTPQGGFNTDYQKTSPSEVIVAFTCQTIPWFLPLLYGCIATVSYWISTWVDDKERVFEANGDKDTTYIRKASEAVTLQFPSVYMSFAGAIPSTLRQTLDDWGVSAEKVSDQNFDTFTIRKPTLEQLLEAMDFPAQKESAVIPADGISLDSIDPLLNIISSISANADSMWKIQGSLHENPEDLVFEMTGDSVPKPKRKEPSTSAELEEGEMDVEEDSRDWFSIRGKPSGRIRIKGARCMGAAYGGVENLRALKPKGIVIPFISAYCAPDPMGLQRYLQIFGFDSMMNASEYGRLASQRVLQSAWFKEINSTEIGIALSHMMACQVIARSCGAFVYHIIKGSRYQGTFILGTNFALRVGGDRICKAETDDEIISKSLNFVDEHDRCLRAILSEAGAMTTDPSMITSLRMLQEVVFAGSGMPSGIQVSRIRKLFPGLAFEQSPMKETTSNMMLIIQYLSDDTLPIPREWYMDTGAFFSQDRFTLILSAFGEKVPSINYVGPDKLRITADIAKGQASTADPYNPTPPAFLQMKKMSLEAGVTQWRSMLQYGIAHSHFKKDNKGTRKFSKAEKVDIWSALNKASHKLLIRPQHPGAREIGTGHPGPSSKRAADRGDEEETRSSKRSKWL